MQVFLPHPDFEQSVQCLDPRRLGNQVYRECLTLIRGSWKNHPVSKMWQGYHVALAQYALAGLRELAARGRHYPHHVATFQQYAGPLVLPPWLGDLEFHRSHQSNLLRKDPMWYGQFGWDVPHDLPYKWCV